MAERKLNPQSDQPNSFLVPVNPANAANFPDQAEIAIVLAGNNANFYDVYQKDIPANLKGAKFPENGKPVHWLNNFGLKDKGGANYRPTVPAYFIRLQNTGATYVYYDGTQIQDLPTAPVPGDNSHVQASLTLGDPAVGWT